MKAAPMKHADVMSAVKKAMRMVRFRQPGVVYVLTGDPGSTPFSRWWVSGLAETEAETYRKLIFCLRESVAALEVLTASYEGLQN